MSGTIERLQAQEHTFVAGHLFMYVGVNSLLIAINSKRVTGAEGRVRAIVLSCSQSRHYDFPRVARTESSGESDVQPSVVGDR